MYATKGQMDYDIITYDMVLNTILLQKVYIYFDSLNSFNCKIHIMVKHIFK